LAQRDRCGLHRALLRAGRRSEHCSYKRGYQRPKNVPRSMVLSSTPHLRHSTGQWVLLKNFVEGKFQAVTDRAVSAGRNRGPSTVIRLNES
jgi:hypothetical protein